MTFILGYSVMPSPFHDNASASSTDPINLKHLPLPVLVFLMPIATGRTGFKQQKLCAEAALRLFRNGVIVVLAGLPLTPSTRRCSNGSKKRLFNFGPAVTSFPRKREDRNPPRVHFPLLICVFSRWVLYFDRRSQSRRFTPHLQSFSRCGEAQDSAWQLSKRSSLGRFAVQIVARAPLFAL
jgi:hypothetical protein